MADFVAVIRRAVDGLSENTPEMRVKVYERARGAVQRQLESMKPRPPEHMLQRQLDKLEAAIRDVESEHAEALPQTDEAGAAAPVAAPEPEEAYAAPHELAEEHAVSAEPADATVEAYEQAGKIDEEGVHAQRDDGDVDTSLVPHEEVVDPLTAGQRDEPVEDWRAAPAPQGVREDVAEAPGASALPQEPREEQPPEPEAEIRYPFDGHIHHVEEPLAYAGSEGEFIERSREEPLHSDGSAHFKQPWFEPAPETAVEPRADRAMDELRELSGHAPPAAAAVEDSGVKGGEAAAKMPPAPEHLEWEASAFDDLPPVEPVSQKKPSASADFDDADLFADVHGAPSTPKPKGESSDGDWRQVEELTGFGKADMGRTEAEGAGSSEADVDQLVASKLQGKSFRMEPKRRRFGIGTILTILVVLAVLGGSGYAAWLNRDALSEMLAGLVSSAPQTATVEVPPAQPTAPPAAPATTSEAPTAPAAGNASQTAALDSGAGGTKFTQRLLSDGSEVDNGPAQVPGQPSVEGRSVAEQNVASADVPPAQGDTAAQPITTGSAEPSQTGAQPSANSAVQKMFLYEERLGQSSPTAIEGSVSWSVQQESGEDGRSIPTVQGKVSVPERNLSALITFKRNADPSLPASHLIEIVFSLPPNFEGGSIDSVQRIALKQTEQDRGDALIAVPAKITDDFYMVALNDYPDARKSNLDLLGTRNWIDIPVTYRNGRRALLTMEKGQPGIDAFKTAINDWAALGDTTSGQ